MSDPVPAHGKQDSVIFAAAAAEDFDSHPDALNP
jgi:hypothetical protein